MSAPLESARDGGWRSIVVRVWGDDGRFFAAFGWYSTPAWICAHGTVWVGQSPPAECDCIPLKITDARAAEERAVGRLLAGEDARTSGKES